jgi:hypothetical protein
MLVVPIKNDTITTRDKKVLRVLSYAPYRASPAVFVEQDGPEPLAVSFKDIIGINKTPVHPDGGAFETVGAFSRKVHLPQPDDIVFFGQLKIRLKAYKLVKTRLAEGLQVHGEDEAGDLKTLPLKQVTQIESPSGRGHSIRAVLSTYAEYLGAR